MVRHRTASPHRRRIRVGFLTLLLWLLLAAPLPAAASLAEAEQDWQQGKLQSAVVRLKDLLQQSPENAQARLLLGRIYLDAGDPLAAEQELMRAREAGANDAETRVLLAEALLTQQALSRAREWTEAPAGATPTQRADLLALRGSVLLSQDKEAEAAVAFSAAIDAAPGSLRATLGMATLELRRGDTDAARETIRQALDLHPESPDPWQALATLERLEQNNEAAIDAYTKAIAYARSSWPLHYQRAALHLDLRNIESAAADIDAVRRQHQRLTGLDYLEGRLLLLQGDNGAAAERLEAYLRRAPSDPTAIFYAALALTRLDRHAQAEEYLLRLTAAVPNNPQALALLARTRLAQGNAAGAEEAIRPVADAADASPLAMELLRQALARQGRTDEAQSLITRAAERFPALASAQLAHARQLLGDGDADGAVTLLTRLVEAEPKNEPARMLLMRAQIAAGAPEQAMAAADAFLERSPKSPMAHTAQGALLAQAGDVDGARAAFATALELDPSFERAALALAALELGFDRPKQAEATLDAALAADPEDPDVTLARAAMARLEGGADAFNARLRAALKRNPEALRLRLVLARSHLAAGDASAARRLLNEAPPEQADITALLMLRGQAELAAGDPRAAAATLNELAERNPTVPVYRHMLASLKTQTGDLRAAESNLEAGLELDRDAVLEHDRLSRILAAQPTAAERKAMMERLLRVSPEHPVLRAARARFLAEQGDFAEAGDILEALADARPHEPAYTLWLADTTARAGRPQEGQRLLEDWLRDHPDSIAGRLSLAQLGIQTDDSALAIQQYRRVLDSNPDNPLALNNLAMLLAEEHPDEALGYAQRALALNPDDAAFIDTKGTVLLAKGDYAAALPLLSKAHAGSTDPSIAFRYAKALAGTGDEAGARRVLLNLKVQSFPEKAQADTLYQRLSGGN